MKRPAVYILTVVLVLYAATLVEGARLYLGLRASVQTQCAAARDIGDLAHAKLTPNPKTGKPSKIAVSFIAHERAAYYGLGCGGVLLSPPSKNFIHWAHIYKTPYK